MGIYLYVFLFLTSAQAEVYLFSGKIGKSSASMRLEIDSKEIKGIYFYHRHKIPTSFSGKKDKEFEVILDTPKGEQFKGLLKDGGFSGIWYQYSKRQDLKNLPFSFSKISKSAFEKNGCFKDIKSQAKKNCKQHDGNYGKEMGITTKAAPDLDGDNLEEILVSCASMCGVTGNCPYELYLSNQGCFKWAGQLEGVGIKVLNEKHNGLSDISTYWTTGCGGKEGVYVESQFDGIKYKVFKKVECKCQETPGSVRPKECP